MSKPINWPKEVPYIDKTVEHVGVSMLRLLNVFRLKGLKNAMVIGDSGQPLAVLMPYSTYMAMQTVLEESANPSGAAPKVGSGFRPMRGPSNERQA